MSVISEPTQGNILVPPSILKTNTPYSKFENNGRTPTRVRFQILVQSDKILKTLQGFINKTDVRSYNDLIHLIRDNEISDEDLLYLLEEIKNFVSLLDEKVAHFVEALLKLKWTHRRKSVIKTYQTFVFNLLSAHNYFVKYAIGNLVTSFLPDKDAVEWKDGIISDEEYNKCVNVHYMIHVLLKVIPMCNELLLEAITVMYPYYKKPTFHHEVYLHNLLWILDYEPKYRLEIFVLIIKNLIILDSNASRHDIEEAEHDEIENEMEVDMFEMDKEDNDINKQPTKKSMKHPIAETLDVCLNKIFSYLKEDCFESGEINWEKTKVLYLDMYNLFDTYILNTHATHHVQFIMFYLCSFKTKLAEIFIANLWNKTVNINAPTIHRQAAIAYLSSFLARANYISIDTLKERINTMVNWIHSYINNHDGLSVSLDVRVHSIFYSICQALFYLIAFKHSSLIESKRSLVFLQNLNLTKIVTSRLNPLGACSPAVVQNFAAVTRTYQLAYCYSIMEHNARDTLPQMYRDKYGQYSTISFQIEAFFPFDPYLLLRSRDKIEPIYSQYQQANNVTTSSTKRARTDADDEDDFLADQTITVTPTKKSNVDLFSYSTSPGFKY